LQSMSKFGAPWLGETDAALHLQVQVCIVSRPGAWLFITVVYTIAMSAAIKESRAEIAGTNDINLTA